MNIYYSLNLHLSKMRKGPLSNWLLSTRKRKGFVKFQEARNVWFITTIEISYIVINHLYNSFVLYSFCPLCLQHFLFEHHFNPYNYVQWNSKHCLWKCDAFVQLRVLIKRLSLVLWNKDFAFYYRKAFSVLKSVIIGLFCTV